MKLTEDAACNSPEVEAAWTESIRKSETVQSSPEPAPAVAVYRKPAELRPHSAEMMFRMASCCHDDGRLNEALAGYLKAAQLQPDLVEAHYNAGLVLQGLGRPAMAAACYRNALQIRSDFAAAHNNLGQIHLGCGQLEQAIACFQQALQHQPDFAEPHFNLGEALRALKRAAAAADHYRIAAELKPRMVEAWNNLGALLKDRGDLREAMRCYRRVVALRPDLAEGYYNLGSALKDAGESTAAVQNLMQALKLRRDYPEAWNNLGLAYKGLAEYQRSLECLSEAARLNPDLVEAHWNRSSLMLLQGQFEEGFEEYEWRFRLPKWQRIYPFRHRLPRWNGTPDPNCRVLVHDEQGLGDTLQFVRYLPLVKERCGKVILEIQPPLLDLLRDLPGADQIVARPAKDGPQAMDADCYAPLMSLPRIFGARTDSIHAVVPYVWADLLKSVQWNKRLDRTTFNVGIVWAGRPEHQNDAKRSCPLRHFLPLSRIPGIRLFSLQKGPGASQIADHQEAWIVDLDPELNDFTDTAAVVSQLDLVLSVDTAVAHLAGAMGRPVWVLLPFVPDWRWLLDRDDSPWYPTMRLFRQPRDGDWVTVMERIESELMTATHRLWPGTRR